MSYNFVSKSRDMSFMKLVRDGEKKLGFKGEILWKNVFIITGYHIAAAYWIYHHSLPVKWQTVAYAVSMYYLTGIGITCGVHRYWTHRSFKANKALQGLLLFFFASAGQSAVRLWVWNHRMHHKYSDTASDPHNPTRGLLYSHCGWLMMKKDPELKSKGRDIDISDILNDPLLKWHEKYVLPVNVFLSFILPTTASVWLWGEAWRVAVAWHCFIRYLAVFHSEMTINSLAHSTGLRPYNAKIQPRQNLLVSFLTLGEGTHNYHHTFPFDYKSGEMPGFFNIGYLFIRLMAAIGWATDLKEASPEMILATSKRIGDGSPIHYQPDLKNKDLKESRNVVNSSTEQTVSQSVDI